MVDFKFNGEHWYADARPISKRALEWLVCVCMAPHWRTLGWDGGIIAGLRERWKFITPISFLGHRITIQGWGASIRTGDGWLVYVWRSGHRDAPYAYVSHNGTSQGAHRWLLNPPPDVVRLAKAHAEKVRVEKAKREEEHRIMREKAEAEIAARMEPRGN